MDHVVARYLVGFMTDAAFLAGVPLAVATVVGVTVSFFQAITQIQDQTFSQTVKIGAIGAMLLVFGLTLVTPLAIRSEQLYSEFWRM